MYKKIVFIICSVFFIFLFATNIKAQSKNIDLYLFYGDGCPHCAKEEEFLEYLENTKDNIKIHRFEVWNDSDNAELLREVADTLGVKVSGVPFLVIGDKSVSGFYNARTTGKKIENIIEDYEINGCSDVVEPVINKIGNKECDHECQYNQDCIGECNGEGDCVHECGCSASNTSNKGENNFDVVTVPFFGEIKVANFSLPLLTIVIAAIDGFNPCAMWILLFLISLLLGMQNRKKMWILGSAFIISSAFVYFLFLSAWLNLFMFLGMIKWVRLLIAVVAIIFGSYHLYDFWKNKDKGCKVESNEKRKAVFDKLRNIVIEQKFWLALGGIIVLAAAVNLVELVCSAGLPAVYTQVLAMSDLDPWKYYAYLILYILVFMLDDLFVFFIAMMTLKMKAISTRYTRWAGIIGGVVMVIIGFLLIFKPGILMFG